MLTEIEWWGGLILIWLSLTFYLIRMAYKDRQSLSVDAVATHIAFLCAASIFVLYFYTLHSLILKYVYVVGLAVGLIMMVVMYLWPDPDEESDTVQDSESEDEEELSEVVHFMIQVFISLPFLVCFGFGVYKIKDYVEVFPFLN
jgi:hypothetical protein